MRGGVETAELILDVTTAAAMRGRSCEETVRKAGSSGSWPWNTVKEERGTSCKVRRGRCAALVPNCVQFKSLFRLSSSYPRQIHLKSARYFTSSVT